MSDQFNLKAELRQDVGKGASRRLRRDADQVPAIIYGAKKEPQMLTLVHKEIVKCTQHEAFFSSILNIEVNGKPQKAIVKAMQRHPSKPRILHIDFMRVSAKEKITMNVPIHLVGEEETPGIKDGGVVSKHMAELAVICLPGDLPENISIDISHMALDESIHISQVVLPAGVELANPIEDDAHDHPVVSVAEPKIVEEPEEETEAATDEEVAEGQTEETAEQADNKASEATDDAKAEAATEEKSEG